MFEGVLEKEVTLIFFVKFSLDISTADFEELVFGLAREQRAKAC